MNYHLKPQTSFSLSFITARDDKLSINAIIDARVPITSVFDVILPFTATFDVRLRITDLVVWQRLYPPLPAVTAER